MISLLVVEDNLDLLDEMLFQLRYAGFTAQGVMRASEMDAQLQRAVPDVLILDLGLPDEDGLSIAQRLKSIYPQLGVIMVTARGHMSDRLTGYRIGADYYLSKPVNFQELSLLVQTLVRRLQPITVALPSMPEVRLVFDSLRQLIYVQRDGVEQLPSLSLTWMEVCLLDVFLQSDQFVASKSDLIQTIGGSVDEFSDMRRLEVAISRLRKKFEKWLVSYSLDGEDLIKVQRHQGYQLTKMIVRL